VSKPGRIEVRLSSHPIKIRILSPVSKPGGIEVRLSSLPIKIRRGFAGVNKVVLWFDLLVIPLKSEVFIADSTLELFHEEINKNYSQQDTSSKQKRTGVVPVQKKKGRKDNRGLGLVFGS
jgi:hypothetical protein